MAVALSQVTTDQSGPNSRAIGSGRRSRSGRARLIKLTPIEMSFEESRHVLYPAQKKLTTVESQRIMTVAKETKKRLEGVLLIPQLPEHIDRYGIVMGAELVTMLQEYDTLSHHYMKCYDALLQEQIQPNLLQTQKSLSAFGTHSIRLPSIYEENTSQKTLAEFKITQHQLRHLTKSILRGLNQCPSIDAIAKEIQATSPLNHGHILSVFSDVVVLMEETLLTTHEEEVKREEYLSVINERYTDSEAEITILETELKLAKEERDKEVRKREEQKKKLLQDIRTTDRFAKEVQKKIEGETTKQEQSNQQTHTNRITKLTEEVTTLKKSLQETKTANKERELQLRKKSYKRETEADNWIQKYDNEIGELQNELETLDTEFDEEKKQVKEIGERLEVLSIEYEVVVKEQEEARKRAEEAQIRMTGMVRAATMIQACWRAYKTRKLLSKDSKKSGKKGKGGKKKGSAKKGGKKK